MKKMRDAWAKNERDSTNKGFMHHNALCQTIKRVKKEQSWFIIFIFYPLSCEKHIMINHNHFLIL